MYRWISGIAVGIVAIAALGVGCGGSGDESATGSEAAVHIPKAQFVKKAESLCVDRRKERLAAAEESYNKKVRAADPTAGTERFQELAEEVLTESILPSLRKQQEDLEALGTPAADEAKIEKMMQSLEQGIDELEQDGFEKLNYNQLDPFEKETKAYGLKCKVI